MAPRALSRSGARGERLSVINDDDDTLPSHTGQKRAVEGIT